MGSLAVGVDEGQKTSPVCVVSGLRSEQGREKRWMPHAGENKTKTGLERRATQKPKQANGCAKYPEHSATEQRRIQ